MSKIAMFTNTDLSAHYETCRPWKNIIKLFLDNDRYKLPPKSPEANIMDQFKGQTYHIPFNIRNFGGLPEGNMELSIDMGEADFDIPSIMEKSAGNPGYVLKSAMTPIDVFFQLVEACRCAGITMYLCERPYLTVPKKKKELDQLPNNWDSPDYDEDRSDPNAQDGTDDDDLDMVNVDLENVDELDADMEEDGDDVDVESLARNLEIDKSGIELDFDIYQRSEQRQMEDTGYWQLVQQVAILIARTLDIQPNMPNGMTDDNFLYTYAVILRKSDVVFGNHPKYGDCYKDSFHLRFPGIKTSKDYKLYLMDRMIKDRVLDISMSGVTTLINSYRDVLDVHSAVFPAMLLGSMKRDGNEPHKFYKLFKVKVSITTPNPSVQLDIVDDFDPIVDPNDTYKIKHPTKKGNCKMTVRADPKFKYNLAHECSLLYEAPRGLIKKCEFEPIAELAHELRLFRERNATYGEFDEKRLVSELEVNAVQNAVSTICNRSFEAKYIKELLDVLDHSRTSEYVPWLQVIRALAWENPEYKPLAIWFSLRNQAAWINNGAEHLEQNWEWALSHRPDKDNADHISVKVIESWARHDNFDGFNYAKRFKSMSIMSKIANDEVGNLTENAVAKLLYSLFGNKFATDEDPLSSAKGSDIKWFEFVFPEDEKANDYTHGFVYKWRYEKTPLSLDEYITEDDKLPRLFEKYMDYNKERIESLTAQVGEIESTGNATGSEVEHLKRKMEYYEKLNKNIWETKRRLGNGAYIRAIIDRCKMKFMRRGFMSVLDKNPDVIGVANGVLQLRPETELIQRYHEIPITRFTTVDYEPYNPKNPIVAETEAAIKRLFATPDGKFDRESYEFNMMYLASSLDAHKKAAIFMIWEGDGSAGKSSLAELHINTLGMAVKGGYGNKMNTDYFTVKGNGSGGPDSEKMSMKYSRYNYCSETDYGEALQMKRIKEFTGGENIAGRELFGKHDVFEPNGIFIFITNNPLTIHGSDYGTWRRIMKTLFRRKFRDRLDPSDPLVMLADTKWNTTAPKDKQYQKAYLSILVKFYEKLRDEYNGDIMKVPHTRISEETQRYRDEQDVYSEFMSRQSVYIGKIYPETSREVKRIPLQEISEKFKKWYAINKGDKPPMSSEILENLRRSINAKYMKEINNRYYLIEHYIMSANEEFNLEEVVAKIKLEENMDDLNEDTDNPTDAPPDDDLPEDDLLEDDLPEDNIDLPDDLSDDEKITDDEPCPPEPGFTDDNVKILNDIWDDLDDENSENDWDDLDDLDDLDL